MEINTSFVFVNVRRLSHGTLAACDPPVSVLGLPVQARPGYGLRPAHLRQPSPQSPLACVPPAVHASLDRPIVTAQGDRILLSSLGVPSPSQSWAQGRMWCLFAERVNGQARTELPDCSPPRPPFSRPHLFRGCCASWLVGVKYPERGLLGCPFVSALWLSRGSHVRPR